MACYRRCLADVGPRGGGDSTVPVRNAATAADLGLSRKEIHEARIIRDAEEAEPGIVKKTLDEAIERGEERLFRTHYIPLRIRIPCARVCVRGPSHPLLSLRRGVRSWTTSVDISTLPQFRPGSARSSSSARTTTQHTLPLPRNSSASGLRSTTGITSSRHGPRSIRGTYLGIYVDESARTPSKALAEQLLTARRRQIERDRLSPPVEPSAPNRQGPTFLSAALAYMDAGGDERFLGTYDSDNGVWTGGLIPHFGEKPLAEIDQAAIDLAATKLYPQGSAPTRNRQVYTPVSAILKHAGIGFEIKRPKGWRGSKRTSWLQPEQAFALFKAADEVDTELAIFLTFLCYTGARLSDALHLTCDRLLLRDAFAYFEETKNGEPRGVHLPPYLVARLANHPRGLERGKLKVFRFRKSGRLYNLLSDTKEKAGPKLAGMTFHILCHTWATWMRRYAGLDTRGLVGTGRWRDEKSAARYEHVVASEEARKADKLPTPISISFLPPELPPDS